MSKGRREILPHPDMPLQRALVDAEQAGKLPSLTAAHFTERELHELRKACRDLKNSGEGSELAGKFLEAAIVRARGAK